MMYEEFKQFKQVKDDKNPFTPHFVIDEERDFYVEPVVFTQLHGFQERHPDKYDLILQSLIERVKKNKKVIAYETTVTCHLLHFTYHLFLLSVDSSDVHPVAPTLPVGHGFAA